MSSASITPRFVRSNISKMREFISFLCFFAIARAQTTAPTGTCDQGWVPYNDYCYLFQVGNPIQWKAAQQECISRDAGLIRLYATVDVNFVVNQSNGRKAAGFWTALNDNPKTPGFTAGTGRWLWGNNEIANMSFIQWNKSPNNDGVSNCGGINLQGMTADVICSARQGYVCSLPGGATSGCPLGWLQGEYQCYWVSNTTDPSQLLTWSDASTWCTNKAQGAGLLVVNNQSDVNFLMNQLPYLAKTTKVHWIGLKYNTNTKQWGWYNNAMYNPSLTQWIQEPDNIAGIENCGVIRRNGQFSDRDCASMSNYICMKPQPIAWGATNLGCGTWTRAGNQCYYFNNNGHMTWQAARGYCQSNGGDLIKVDSFDKQEWLSQQLLDPSLGHVYWTGLNDMASEGSYVWADGSPANQSFIKWNREPNNYQGQEDCALIYGDGGYNDISCGQHAAAICEIRGTTSCPDNTWILNNQSCYLFTPFNNVSALYNNLEATTYCQSFALTSTVVGALLSVNDINEKAFIKSTLANQPDNVYGWWTSLNDKQTEGFWQFADNSYDDSLVDWISEPSKAPSDDCGLVQYEGAFHERDCSRQIPFICERYAAGFSGSSITKAWSFIIAVATLIAVLAR